MKIASLTIFLLLSSSVFAQQVTVTPQVRIYRRPAKVSEYKRTFKVRRPIVKAATPALSRKITAAVSPEKLLDIDIKAEIVELWWLDEADHTVEYNDHGILCIKAWMEGSGAYPDGVTRHVVIDTKTGEARKVEDLFTNLAGLAALVRSRQKKEIDDAISEIKANKDLNEDDPAQLFEGKAFDENSFDQFSVSASGVTFYYDYGFPHVIRAIEPEGEYKLTWAEVKGFVRPDGLLARFVR